MLSPTWAEVIGLQETSPSTKHGIRQEKHDLRENNQQCDRQDHHQPER